MDNNQCMRKWSSKYRNEKPTVGKLTYAIYKNIAGNKGINNQDFLSR